MRIVLHQCRRKSVLKRVTILERNMRDGFHRVEILGETYWQTSSAKFDDETREQLEHWRRRCLSRGHGGQVLPISSCAERRASLRHYRPEAPSTPSQYRSDTSEGC